MHDDVIAELAIKRKEFVVEIQIASRGARSPLPTHWSYVNGCDPRIELTRPFADAIFEFFFASPPCHGLKLFRSSVNKASTVAVTFSISSSSRRSAKAGAVRAWASQIPTKK